MVSGKLPFKEHQPPRMLQLIRRGPIFRPGLSPGEQHHSMLLSSPSSCLVSNQRPGPTTAESNSITPPHQLEKYHTTHCMLGKLRVELTEG